MFEQIIDKPESPMRFFTPELYLRYNSEDEDEADEAQRDWDEATARYQHHLKAVLRNAPESVRGLARSCFHDAVMRNVVYDPVYGDQRIPYYPVGIIPPSVPRPSPTRVQLVLPGRAIGLVYLTWDSLIVHRPLPGWPNNEGQPLWLYDEVDEIWGRFGMYVHRILLSCGRVYEIPFYDVVRLEVSGLNDQSLSPESG